MAKIAFLGTGLLGSALAEAAAMHGDIVTAWNRSPEKLTALAAFGIQAATTPIDAVRDAERVHLVLKDDAVVEAVIEAMRNGLSPTAVIVDHSTTAPKLTAERASRLQREGLRYLHCPVFMGPAAARKVQGSMLAAGPAACFDSVREDLAKMTGKLVYLGERPDLAAINKLLGNTMIIGMSSLIADVLTQARANKLESADAIDLLGLLDFGGMIAARGTNMAKGNFTPSFELAMARKDVQLMLDAAGDLPLAALPSIAARMDQLLAEGHGAEDVGILGLKAVRP